MSNLTTGQYLRKYRMAHGFTQRALAEKLGVKAAHLSEIENGHRRVSVSRGVRWASILGLPEMDLVSSALQEELDVVGIEMTVGVKDGR